MFSLSSAAIYFALLGSTFVYPSRAQPHAAIYFATNHPDGNYIISASADSHGKLAYADKFWTGGLGGHGQTSPSTNGDGLFSQSSIAVANNFLAIVNAGSSTVTLFNINPKNPAHIRLAGAPVWSGGEFPVSATIDKKTGNVCVLNSGAYNSVSCYTANMKAGLRPIANSIRSLNLNATTPPSGPPGTPSQILFSEDGKQLYVSVKGPMGSPGFIAVWKVNADGSLSTEFEKNTPTGGGATLFSMTFIEGTNGSALLNADPSIGYNIFGFKDMTIAKDSAVSVPGQAAICWSEYSKGTGNYYLVDAGMSLLTEVHIDPRTLNSTIVKQYAQPNNSGPIDFAIAPVGGIDYAYILAPRALSVEAVALSSPGQAKTIQSFDINKAIRQAGVATNATFLQGMAAFSVGK